MTDDLVHLAYERRRAFLEDIRDRKKARSINPGKAIPRDADGGTKRMRDGTERKGGYREGAVSEQGKGARVDESARGEERETGGVEGEEAR